MRTFNYSAIKEQKWDSDVLGLIAAIYKEAGKQELYLKQRPEELEILRGAVRFVHQKPCNRAGFPWFEKLNILLFFPSVLSKALFHRKKAGKNGG